MPINTTRISRLEKALGIGMDDGAAGPLLVIVSNMWPAADREAYEAAHGAERRDVGVPDVATVHGRSQAAAAIIARRTGISVFSGVIDVPAPAALVAMDEAARETWLNAHESRPWKYGAERAS